MADCPTRYNIETDELVPVTQDWVDKVTTQFMVMGAARRAARSVIEIRDGLMTCPPPELQAFLDAWKPEFAVSLEAYINARIKGALREKSDGG